MLSTLSDILSVVEQFRRYCQSNGCRLNHVIICSVRLALTAGYFRFHAAWVAAPFSSSGRQGGTEVKRMNGCNGRKCIIAVQVEISSDSKNKRVAGRGQEKPRSQRYLKVTTGWSARGLSKGQDCKKMINVKLRIATKKRTMGDEGRW